MHGEKGDKPVPLKPEQGIILIGRLWPADRSGGVGRALTKAVLASNEVLTVNQDNLSLKESRDAHLPHRDF